MAFVRCNGGGKLAFPLNLLAKSWTPVKPNTNVHPVLNTPVTMTCDVKTPTINNNIINCTCYTVQGRAWTRVHVSVDGVTWTDVGGTNGSETTGYHTSTIALSAYNGSELFVRVTCSDSYNDGDTFAPCGILTIA